MGEDPTLSFPSIKSEYEKPLPYIFLVITSFW